MKFTLDRLVQAESRATEKAGAPPHLLRHAPSLVVTAFLVGLAGPAVAQSTSDENSVSRCAPCVGITATDDVPARADDLDIARAPLFVYRPGPEATLPDTRDTWTALLDADIVTGAPLLQNAVDLDRELSNLSRRLESAGEQPRVRLRWRGGTPADAPADWDFLIKRAAVAVTGAQPDARLLIDFARADLDELRALLNDDLAAYVDGIVLERPELDAAAVERLTTFRQELALLDPDSELVVLGLDAGPNGGRALAQAARVAEIGGQVALFGPTTPEEALLPSLQLWSSEFAGDVTFDPYSSPSGAPAWSFVRGEDLALRVVVEPASAGATELEFTDRSLTSPRLLRAGGEPQQLFSGRRTRSGYRVTLTADDAVGAPFLLAFERQGLGALEGVEGVEDRVEVEDERGMPVEEILRRLQATEDAQARRLRNYSAVNTTSLRFLLGGAQSLDTTFRGPLFFNADGTFDWAWREFYVNGVKWRRKTIPEIPLIQPEKATQQPVDISFTKDYRYRLRGTATVNGRDTWVVDFEPTIKPEAGRSLFQGTVWVDREVYARVKTNAIQLGLTGDVISNEETTTYEPLDANGNRVAWSRGAFVLGTRLVGQQLFSILGGTTVVEREVLLTEIAVNPDDFARAREEVLASEVTMVRDTAEGLRYLVNDKEGNRVVKDELDKSRLFLVGGVFYDESLDFPLPLAGVNWFNFDFKGTGTQTNVFWGGPLLIADIADPSLFGSRWDLGIDAFVLALSGEDSFFRNGQEIKEETLESTRPNIDISLGRPIGQFFKVSFEYSLGFNRFDRADDTADEFVIPEDHLDHRFQLTTDYNRRGYRLRLRGSHNIRSDWEEWGLPGNTDFDPEQEEYQRWGASVRKVWHLPKFTKFGAELEYAGGENLDRFSKYQFGFFSDLVVRGYRSERIRAEEIKAAHLSYGFNLGDVFRVDLVGDAAFATDELSGFEDELLAGLGLNGTVIGPWGTVVNFDIGFPVAGPENGFTAFIAFLKLFNR